MVISKEIFLIILGFIWVVIASNQISLFFQKIKLPLISGFILSGIIAGPFVLELIPTKAVSNLIFIQDFSLAYIAFAAGAELYMKELRGSGKSIIWNTFGQLVITFLISFVAIFYLADIIPFMKNMNLNSKIAVSLLIATIFIARSPSSAIAVISEMRAKGRFTKTAISVTVIKDILVVVLFTICFSLANTLITGVNLHFSFILVLIFELLLTFGIGYILGKVIIGILSLNAKSSIKTIFILILGYSTYLLSHFIREKTLYFLPFEIYFEPLLVCITAAFIVINYSNYRAEFQKIIHKTGPIIYATFFTLIGASMSIDILLKLWFIASILFIIRLVTLIIGAYIGSVAAGDPKNYRLIGWMPYVTQAGIGLAIVAEVAVEFPEWGNEFATLIIAVIILNQIIGPPLFKWSIKQVGESHLKAKQEEIEKQSVLIFGLEDSSLALANQIKKQGWETKIVTLLKKFDVKKTGDIEICQIQNLNIKELDILSLRKVHAIVLMLSDKENLNICRFIYEKIGTKKIIVRLTDRSKINRFHELDALVVEPSTAIVNLLDHSIRSPIATSLLLGMEHNKDAIDVEIRDENLHGVSLRNLRLPADVLVLSVKRKGETIISHGYTKLRKRDIISLVGSIKSLEEIKLLFEK